MTEFVSKINRNEYEITFKTSIWSEYKEIQEAMRSIIDNHKTAPIHLNTNTCVSCGAEIPEGYHVCPICLKEW